MVDDQENFVEAELQKMSLGDVNFTQCAQNLLAMRAKRLIASIDRVREMQDSISTAQSRQQWVVITLSVVIALSTVFYTWVTWESVTAMRESNTIQRQMLDVQREQLRLH